MKVPVLSLGLQLDEYTLDHCAIVRARQLIDLDTYREVFAWMLASCELLDDKEYHSGAVIQKARS